MALRTRKELRACVLGTLLGDSWLTKQGHWSCEQVTLELITLKRQIAEALVGRSINIRSRERAEQQILGRRIAGKRTFLLSVCDPHFKKYYRILYKNGKKRVTASLLRRLTPEAIALWVMDDGYLDYKKSNNTRYFRLCTDSFSRQEHELFIKYFTSLGIDCFIYEHKSSKYYPPKPRLSFTGNNAQKLIGLIYRYILPCFYYKIDLRYSRMDSKNINPLYREAVEYITQNRAPFGEDIV